MKFLAMFPLFLLAACSTPQSRIDKNPELFATFPPEVQASLKAGKVDLGFTTEMTHIALGEPARIYTRKTADHTETIWKYVYLYRDIRTQSVRFSGEIGSGWVDLEDTREIPYKTITFVEDKVTAIEELSER